MLSTYVAVYYITNFFYLTVFLLTFTSGEKYSLYWSGASSNSFFNGASNNSFFSVWEAFPFSIKAFRVQEISTPPLTTPPGNPSRFEGRLREISLIFRSSDLVSSSIILGGKLSTNIFSRKNGQPMLPSHYALYSQKYGSFWEEEYRQRQNAACKDGSKYYPGCLDSPDISDNSFINLLFPVGQASLPHGKYADGIISVLLTKFNDKWKPYEDFNSPHQNFVLLLLRMFEK